METAAQAGTRFAAPPVPLSPFEDICCRIGDRYDGDGTGAIVARISGRIEDANIRAALDLVQQRHPKLRARVVLRPDGNRYFEFPDPPPRIPLEIKDGEGGLPWLDEAYRAVYFRMEISIGPLCRMLVFRDRAEDRCYLIFIAHHAIIDAASMIRIVDDLLEYNRQLAEVGAVAAVVSRPLVSIARAPVSQTILRRLLTLADIIVMRIGKRRGNWLALPQAKCDPPHPWLEHHVFTEGETAALMQRCREERTAFTAALFAVGVGALVDVIPDENFRLRCTTYLSMRQFLEGPEGSVSSHDLGCFVSGYGRTFRVNRQSTLWDRAHEHWRGLERFMIMSGPQVLYNLFRLSRSKLSVIPLKRDTLQVNYFGVAKVRSEYGGVRLEECLTLVKSSRFGASLNIWAVVVRGRLCVWTIINNLSDEFARTYWPAVMKQFRNLIDAKSP